MTVTSSARLLSVALLSASVSFIGCSSPKDTAKPAPGDTPREHAVAPPGEGGEPGSLAGEERLTEIKRQEDEFIAQKLLETAKIKIQRSEFQAAMADLEEARRLNPGSRTSARSTTRRVS